MSDMRSVQLNARLGGDVIKALRQGGLLAEEDLYRKDRVWHALVRAAKIGAKWMEKGGPNAHQ